MCLQVDLRASTSKDLTTAAMSKLKKDTMVTLVPDQDVTLAESGQLMTVMLFSPIEGSIRRVTDVCASVDACLKSPYLKSLIEVAKVQISCALHADRCTCPAESVEIGSCKHYTGARLDKR